jgi:hypothetical protein
VTLDPIERLNLALCAGAAAVSLALATPGFAVSLLVGAALESVNFRGLRGSARMLFDFEGTGPAWSGVFALRFTLLAVGIGAALYAGAHPVGLLLGLSLIVPATVVHAWVTRPRPDPSAPALDPDDPGWELWNAWLARERVPASGDGEEVDP